MQTWVGCLRVVKYISLKIFPPCFGKYLQPSMYGGIVHSKTLTWLINDQIESICCMLIKLYFQQKINRTTVRRSPRLTRPGPIRRSWRDLNPWIHDDELCWLHTCLQGFKLRKCDTFSPKYQNCDSFLAQMFSTIFKHEPQIFLIWNNSHPRK